MEINKYNDFFHKIVIKIFLHNFFETILKYCYNQADDPLEKNNL